MGKANVRTTHRLRREAKPVRIEEACEQWAVKISHPKGNRTWIAAHTIRRTRALAIAAWDSTWDPTTRGGRANQYQNLRRRGEATAVRVLVTEITDE